MTKLDELAELAFPRDEEYEESLKGEYRGILIGLLPFHGQVLPKDQDHLLCRKEDIRMELKRLLPHFEYENFLHSMEEKLKAMLETGS